jgi:sec-independent protein translocase protein TatB
MFGLGFWEIAIIALVTLIFVKPEDLPKILRKIGYYYGRIKEIGRSVQSQIEETETFFWDKPDSSAKEKNNDKEE